MKERISVATEGKDKKVISPEDVSKVLQDSLSPDLKERIRNLNIEYVELTPGERDACIRASVSILLDPTVDAAGEHQLDKWETGWTHNLEALRGGKDGALLPLYFKNDDIVRWRQNYIKPLESGFDYAALSIILDWLFHKYFRDLESIYEFGCGTGHHLLHVRNFNPKAKIYGLDWAVASQEIIKEMAQRGLAKNIFGRRFDFFNPDEGFVLDSESGVYTVGALEQVGDRHERFLAYLLENKPKVCFHVEPIGELLDESNLVDYLAKEYYKKRNYLTNFISHLKLLEQKRAIRIQKMQRTYLGGNLFTEYMVVVWVPVL